MKRSEMLRSIATNILSNRNGQVVRVGVSGITSSGKTTFANELTDVLKEMEADVIRALMDDFHHPKSKRYIQSDTYREEIQLKDILKMHMIPTPYLKNYSCLWAQLEMGTIKQDHMI
ncbi:hypothetical protein VBD025_14740 [Virgibacillus flavescens]|uniref:hypothetical protein n=1 Tax=Virgibacillus flavescens TaxID=1611422 RepID=UPI003D358805